MCGGMVCSSSSSSVTAPEQDVAQQLRWAGLDEVVAPQVGVEELWGWGGGWISSTSLPAPASM